ncbi:MAG: hypothetical protein ABWW65_02385 [Thermoprotei archaeon]
MSSIREFILIVHPTCPSSRRVLEELKRENLLEEVEIIEAINPWIPLRTAGSLVWSVPWLISKDKGAVACDPFEKGEITSIIRGEYSGILLDSIKLFTDAVLHSNYAVITALVHESLEPVLDPVFIQAATRAAYTGVKVDIVRQEFLERSRELYEELYDKLVRVAGLAYVRMLYWASNGKLSVEQLVKYSDPVLISTWLLSSASYGRIGLPAKPGSINAARDIADFITRNASGLLNKVMREYSTR